MRNWKTRFSWMLAILAIVGSSGAFIACSSPFGASTTGQVFVNFGSGGSGRAPGIPANVASIDISIKASDMTPIVVKLTTPSLSATIDVPAGADRSFEVVAMAAGDIPAYRGTTSMTIQAGAVHDLSVTMANLYALVYDANGATGGTAPATLYREAGTALVVAPNSGALVKTGYVFDGWNTASDGSGTAYLLGASVTIPVSGITLYADWSVPLSNDATLSGLVTNPVTLNTTFLSNLLSYTGVAPSSFPTIDVTPTASNANADIMVRINGGTYAPVTSGSTLGSLALNAANGNNILEVKVTAENGTTVQTYTVTIAKTVMITISPGIGGSVSPGSGEFTPGAIISLTATPDAGYRFTIWSITGDASVAPINGASANMTVPVTSPSWVTANFTPDFSGGTGTLVDPYLVGTLAELKRMNQFRSAFFRLTASINLVSETNWLPIGDATTKFTGGFDGNGFTLSNLTINTAVDPNRGLFGYVDGAVISDVNLTGINFIDTFESAGGLIGTTIGATQVSNCSVSGSMTAYQSAGGLIGLSDAGSTLVVSNCWTDVAITATNWSSIGGLIGYSMGGSVVKSYTLGSITKSSPDTVDNVGGLVGYNNAMSVTNCYARGNATGDSYVGGLIGFNTGANVTNSYSTGFVTAVISGAGGLIGISASGTITSSYYDTDTSGQADSLGKGDPLSTALMKAAATHATTYAGWDFATIWDAFVDGQYPTLRP